MKQEFFTSRGKVVIERNILYVKNIKTSFSDTILFTFLPLILPVVLGLHLIYFESEIKWFIRLFIYTSLNVIYFDKILDLLVRKSFSSRIPLQNINSVEIKQEEDPSLESFVILHLKSGRYRSIPFRTRENEFQSLAELISQHLTQPQLTN